MIDIRLGPDIREKCPQLQLAVLQCSIQVEAERADLWELIDSHIVEIQNRLVDTKAIAPLPAIQSTRRGYKSCGKDPARYRASAESLLRRVLQGKGLYKVNNIVDLLNLVSIQSGFSIGGYDLDKIQGNVSMGIGQINEDYTGIGRGDLNIEFLPVLRDERGPFGSPTSDSMRTRIETDSSRFLMVCFAFGAADLLEQAVENAKKYLEEFGGASAIASKIIKNHVG